jgi:hypothetical protein
MVYAILCLVSDARDRLALLPFLTGACTRSMLQHIELKGLMMTAIMNAREIVAEV